MPIMIKDNKSVLFIHIPKCGGSTFEKTIKDMGWRELFSFRGLHLSKLKFMKCTPQHMHAEILDQIVNKDQFTKIVAIVRNPFDRLISEYFWQLKQGITNLAPEDWIDDTFSKYQSNNYIYDNHIRPQSEFLMDGVEIYKIENNGIYEALNLINNDENTIPNLSNEKKTVKDNDIIKEFNNKKEKIEEFYKEDFKRLNY